MQRHEMIDKLANRIYKHSHAMTWSKSDDEYMAARDKWAEAWIITQSLGLESAVEDELSYRAREKEVSREEANE